MDAIENVLSWLEWANRTDHKHLPVWGATLANARAELTRLTEENTRLREALEKACGAIEAMRLWYNSSGHPNGCPIEGLMDVARGIDSLTDDPEELSPTWSIGERLTLRHFEEIAALRRAAALVKGEA